MWDITDNNAHHMQYSATNKYTHETKKSCRRCGASGLGDNIKGQR